MCVFDTNISAGTYLASGLNHFVVLLQLSGSTSLRFIKVLWIFIMLRLVGGLSVQHFVANSVRA